MVDDIIKKYGQRVRYTDSEMEKFRESQEGVRSTLLTNSNSEKCRPGN
jgi:hypothetical protein